MKRETAQRLFYAATGAIALMAVVLLAFIPSARAVEMTPEQTIQAQQQLLGRANECIDAFRARDGNYAAYQEAQKQIEALKKQVADLTPKDVKPK